MNVLQSLTELYNHLSLDSTYRNVCKGILENLDEAANGTVYDIAELTNSSRTTVWRMVQKLGYKNFTDFYTYIYDTISVSDWRNNVRDFKSDTFWYCRRYH